MNFRIRDAAGAGDTAFGNASRARQFRLRDAAAFGLDQVLQGMK
ncbi:MAG TPA: hypothetical protein VK845_13275 [Gemmatimonadales bacterium]|nr:hypothetical protein [Gemmatimonadales bacterium]